MSFCRTCRREYAEPGFCPYDGTPLLEASDDSTNPDAASPEVSLDLPVSDREPTAGMSAELVAAGIASLPLEPKLEIGETLDRRYIIEEQIGEGGMGMVYRARHAVIEKLVAVKVLRAEVASDDAVVQRFVQEARAASRIGHPNIVDVTDFGETDDGMTYQVMEYLEGETVAALLHREKTLDLPRALRVIVQMARALGAAHKKGIVHRDLKPENIFLIERDGRNDFVKIVDFGIAKILPGEHQSHAQRLTRAGAVFGTPEYMAPEQAAGKVDVDSRADIYALATILYEMLVGSVPHRGSSVVRTLAMQMLDPIEAPNTRRPDLDLSGEVEEVILKALSKKREGRYATMDDFIEALENATSDTELDLEQLIRAERMSAELLSQSAFDTIPEAVLDGHREQDLPARRRRGSELMAADLARRAGRHTDPVFLRELDPTQAEVAPAEERERRKTRALWLAAAAGALACAGVLAYVLLASRDDESSSLALVSGDAGSTLDPDASQFRTEERDGGGVTGTDAAQDSSERLDKTGVAGDGRDSPDERVSRTTQTDRREDTPVEDPAGDGYVADAGGIPPLGVLSEREITVVTRPRGASLYIGNSYAGSDGLNMRRRSGEEIKMRCELKGFVDGKVTVRFDGRRDVFLCRLGEKPTKKCVEGVKNPFEDCP